GAQGCVEGDVFQAVARRLGFDIPPALAIGPRERAFPRAAPGQAVEIGLQLGSLKGIADARLAVSAVLGVLATLIRHLLCTGLGILPDLRRRVLRRIALVRGLVA